MNRALFAVAITLGTFVGGEPSALAASRSIKQLPADVAHWSTIWMEVPKQVVHVGKEHGPLAAVTWGPAKGMTTLVRSTVTEVWEIAKVDEDPSRQASRGRANGGLFRYEF